MSVIVYFFLFGWVYFFIVFCFFRNLINIFLNKVNNYYFVVYNKSLYDGIYNEIRLDVNVGGIMLMEVVLWKKKDFYVFYDSLDFDDGVGVDMVGGKWYSVWCLVEIVVFSILLFGWLDLLIELEKILLNGY